MNIGNVDALAVPWSRDRAPERESSHQSFTTAVTVGAGPASTVHWVISHLVEKHQMASCQMTRRSLRLQPDVEADMSAGKHLPHVAVSSRPGL